MTRAIATIVALAASCGSATEDEHMWMTVNDHRFSVSLADNSTAKALTALLPLSLEMAELNRNEKFATLPSSLPTQASAPGTIRAGDVMLYGADTLVVFYAAFESSYAYTRIGRVDDAEALAASLGRGVVRVQFSTR